ncbi:FecCD family ABC transporter permease [Anditalea andensis]|uniref:ABC transporter permease n=1 Tax=Anditalea andensis TaxID=1048983 RepID=A0A074KQD5_9BACT|nr:iron ABC transporter permease [Anditalea andensis]KEO72146.1 ABC transporter permease [Anditalea andensis]
MALLLQEKKLSNRKNYVLIGLGVLLFIVVLFSLQSGAYTIPSVDVLKILSSHFGADTGATSIQKNVLLHIRLPRLLMALMVGGGLGIAGAALQGLFRNPLVEPGLIGVSSGAALAAVCLFVFGASFPWLPNLMGAFTLPMAAFVGGLAVTMLVYRLSQAGGKTDISLLILAGVALNALAGALIGLSLFYADDAALRSFTFWSMGDVGGTTWSKVHIALPIIGIACLLLGKQHKGLNGIAIGEAEAYHMGINVQRLKIYVLVLSALIVGTGVSVTGAIGFVGLIVPHLIRLTIGSDHKIVLPASFLMGAILLSLSDLIARMIIMPAEMPIGIITAIIGAPFFIWLIINVKKLRS